MPSENGKKAADAATEFDNFSGTNSWALLEEILQLSNLLGCPAPIPIVDFPFTRTIALDLTNRHILNANIKLAICFFDGFFLVTIFILFAYKTLSLS